MNRFVLPGVLALAVVSGCSDDTPENATENTAAQTAKAQQSTLVDYVPADTSYVVANLEPLPEDLRETMWRAIEPMGDWLDGEIEAALNKYENAEEGADPGDPVTKAVFRELKGKLNREGLAELGLNGDFYAFYGDHSLPVLRMQLGDGSKLEAAIDRIEADAGKQIPTTAFGDRTAYHYADDEGQVVFFHDANEAVFSLAPAGEAGNAAIARVVAGNKPASSARGLLEGVNNEHGLTPHGTAVVDFVRLLSDLLVSPEPESQGLYADLREELSEVCRIEISELASAAPRMVSGYTSVSSEEMTQFGLIELRDDIAAGMSTLTVPMKGMTLNDAGIMNGGMSFSVSAAKTFAQQRLTAMKEDPFECEKFADFNAEIDTMLTQLNQPLPPFVGNFQGIRFQLDSLQMPGDGGGEPVAKALVALGVTNPQALVGMGQMMVPQLAELRLTADGEPVAVPEGLLPPTVTEPFVSMMNHGIAMSIGEGQKDQLKSFLDASAPEGEAPFMVMSYDMKAYADLSRQFMEMGQAMSAMEGDQSDQARSMMEMQKAMQAYYETFSRVDLEILFTQRGIEMFSSTEIAPDA